MAVTRTVSVLGSTGSVGASTVDLLLQDPGAFRVRALVGGSNVTVLAEQARRLQAEVAVLRAQAGSPEPEPEPVPVVWAVPGVPVPGAAGSGGPVPVVLAGLVAAVDAVQAAGALSGSRQDVLLLAGVAVKYAVPGKRMKADGLPNLTLLLGGVGAVVGFFAIPVVGVPIGFVLGIYIAELQRVGSPEAWPSTKKALRAVGVSMMIEMSACTLAAATWAAGVSLT